MERLPKRECHVFNRPGIWDLIGWDRETKKYTLRNDSRETVGVFHNEFVPVSLAGEDLVLASETGEIVPATEAMERGLKIGQDEPSAGPSLNEPKTTTKRPGAPRISERVATGAAGEARAKVRDLLTGATSREAIANIAAGVLNESTETLIEKYAHLDNGRFRMVLGNRMVGALK